MTPHITATEWRLGAVAARTAVILIWACAACLACAQTALACASCGSGGDDPLILAPDERVKVYAAASRTGGYQYLMPGGQPAFSSGPIAKDAFVLAVGKSLGPQAFLTVTLPMVRNVGAADSTWGVGDPLLAARYTALPQTFMSKWMPQVQVLAAYRPALAPSVRDSADIERLDVFGAGYHEARAGVDVWWGMMDWKFGAAFTGLFAFPHAWHDDTMQPGMGLRETLTVGYGRAPYGRVVTGVVREDQLSARLNGAPVPHSGHTLHSLFVTGDATLTQDDTLRISYARIAAFLSDNTSRAHAVSLAYMHAW